MQKALLRALLSPQDRLKAAENSLDFTTRLVLSEEARDLPFAAIWAEHCARADVPLGQGLLAELDSYQQKVTGRG